MCERMIAVVMGAPDYKIRFGDAQTLLAYGFGVSDVFVDENQELLPELIVEGGVIDEVTVAYEGEFRYLDINGNNLTQIEKVLDLPESVQAPIAKGGVAGKAKYIMNGTEIGSVNILFQEDIEKAVYKDYLKKIFNYFLM